MSRAAKTMFVWSIYLLTLGATLVIAPNVLLGLFGVPLPTEVWIRVVGVLVLILAYFSYSSARVENTPYIRWTVPARSSVILFFGAFVALGLVKPVLLLLGVVDLAAAVWTGVSLRRMAPDHGVSHTATERHLVCPIASSGSVHT